MVIQVMADPALDMADQTHMDLAVTRRATVLQGQAAVNTRDILPIRLKGGTDKVLEGRVAHPLQEEVPQVARPATPVCRPNQA